MRDSSDHRDDRCRPAERSRGYCDAAEQAAGRVRRGQRLAAGPQGRRVPAEIAESCRQFANFLDIGGKAARLRLHAEGLPSGRAEGRPAIWRNAPLHSNLCQLDGSKSCRNAGQPPSAANWPIQIRHRPNHQGFARSHRSHVSTPLFCQADIRVRHIWNRIPISVDGRVYFHDCFKAIC